MVPTPRAAETKGKEKNILKKIFDFLRSTDFDLLNQIKGKFVTDFFFFQFHILSFFVKGPPPPSMLLLPPCAKKLSHAGL